MLCDDSTMFIRKTFRDLGRRTYYHGILVREEISKNLAKTQTGVPVIALIRSQCSVQPRERPRPTDGKRWLYRTEVPFLTCSDFPDERTQLALYQKVLTGNGG